jgi:hypothetical protein
MGRSHNPVSPPYIYIPTITKRSEGTDEASLAYNVQIALMSNFSKAAQKTKKCSEFSVAYTHSNSFLEFPQSTQICNPKFFLS